MAHMQPSLLACRQACSVWQAANGVGAVTRQLPAGWLTPMRPVVGMQAGRMRKPGLLAVEPSPFGGGEPRIRVRLEVEGDWDEAAVAERRQSHGEASTSGGNQSPSERSDASAKPNQHG